jgi:hypothetical protein
MGVTDIFAHFKVHTFPSLKLREFRYLDFINCKKACKILAPEK